MNGVRMGENACGLLYEMFLDFAWNN